MARNKSGKRRLLYSNDYTPIYFTYYLVFPKGETWLDQIEFQNHTTSEMNDYEIDRTAFPLDVRQKLKHKKEADWKDHNGVTHRVIIETQKRERVWGVKR